MSVDLDDAEGEVPLVEEAVGRIGNHLSAIDVGGGADNQRGKPPPDNDDLPRDLSHISAGYKRALWIVVVLNAGDRVVEMVGGFFSGSQALKAEALDFLATA